MSTRSTFKHECIEQANACRARTVSLYRNRNTRGPSLHMFSQGPPDPSKTTMSVATCIKVCCILMEPKSPMLSVQKLHHLNRSWRTTNHTHSTNPIVLVSRNRMWSSCERTQKTKSCRLRRSWTHSKVAWFSMQARLLKL